MTSRQKTICMTTPGKDIRKHIRAKIISAKIEGSNYIALASVLFEKTLDPQEPGWASANFISTV